MNQRQHRSILSALALVTFAAFAACGGVDDRKVTRGPDVAVGGDGSGNTSNGGAGNEPSIGGTSSLGGDGTTNPFGGEFSGGAPPVLQGPPEVLEVDPENEDDRVSPTANVSLLFSEALDESTVTNEHVQILDGDDEVDGALSYEGVVASFKPASRLSLLATYDVNVTTGVTDTSGEPLKEPFASTFTVRDGEWDRQRSAVTDPQIVREHATGIDAQGNLLIAYTRLADPSSPNSTFTVAARWVPASSSTPGPEMLLEENRSTAHGLRVAVDAEGNAVVAWQSVDAKNMNVIRARRFVNGEWERQTQTVRQKTTAVPMDSATESAVAIGAGQVVAVWVRYYYQSSVSYYVIEYSSTTLDGAWSEPLSPHSVTNTSPRYEYFDGVGATVDAKGTAIVTFVWHSSTGTYKGVYFARRAVGMEWEWPIKIPESGVSPGYGGGPVLVSDGEGAMAVWFEYLNYEYRLRASRYTRARQFAESVEISDPKLTTNARIEPQGLVTNGTSYWVTWTQARGNSQNVYAKRYDIASSTWDAEPTLVSDGVSTAESSVIGVDAHGNALVVYDQRAASNSRLIMGARYVARSGKWSDAAALTEPNTYFQRPLLVVAGNGVAGLLYSSELNESTPAAVDQAGLYRIFK